MEKIDNEYYVSLEVAKLLKEAGFKWGCRAAWDLTFPDEPYLNHAAVYPTDFNNDVDDILYAPTLDVAQRWLREVKNMSVEISFENPGKWSCCVILDTNKGVSFENFWREEFDYGTYEEAQEAGIKKSLILILEEDENR